jgi:hypothetical protein
MRSSFRYWWPEANAPRVVPPYAGVRVAMTIGEGDPLAAGPDANIRAIEKEEEEDAESAGSDPVRRARICWFSASSGVLLLLGLLGVLLFRRHRRSSKSGEIGGQKSDTIPITDRHE